MQMDSNDFPVMLALIFHYNRYEMAEMTSFKYKRCTRTIEGTKDVLFVLRRCPTGCSAADEDISDITVDSRENAG